MRKKNSVDKDKVGNMATVFPTRKNYVEPGTSKELWDRLGTVPYSQQSFHSCRIELTSIMQTQCILNFMVMK